MTQTPPTTSYERGDVVLIGFKFPKKASMKQRPALVVSSKTYNQGRQEVVLSAITSHDRQTLPGDTVLQDWKKCGLWAPSTATGILRTVKVETIMTRLGKASPRDLRSVGASLRLSVGL
ncbi:MAG: type II toxin-antitoxin system PemK/MazF family toxin [Dehalococcoidia bacterium]|nr:type II toxin-antitoxin system PemK/MazF family toxin [Chloroflexota bacterium]MCZ6866790.1 type II toxin-antitoxin system PemK/MazF family toxin [Chloroflexota bacterium]